MQNSAGLAVRLPVLRALYALLGRFRDTINDIVFFSAVHFTFDMHILLTGASGQLGSWTLLYLLARKHSVLAVDLVPLPASTAESADLLVDGKQVTYSFVRMNLVSQEPLAKLVQDAQPRIDSVIHLGAIPNPVGKDPIFVHNNNVMCNYNLLYTCIQAGIHRIVQASSVNAVGLSYSSPGHHRFYEMPVTENHPILPVSEQTPPSKSFTYCQEDPYALSKA